MNHTISSRGRGKVIQSTVMSLDFKYNGKPLEYFRESIGSGTDSEKYKDIIKFLFSEVHYVENGLEDGEVKCGNQEGAGSSI